MRRVLFVLLLGLLALLPLTIACRPRFDCMVQSNSVMVEDAFATQTQYGAASELQVGFKQPWPEVMRNGQRLRVSTYCYETPGARRYLDCPWLAGAFDRWRDRLNEPGFAGTTNLKWEELSDGSPDPTRRQPLYCFGVDQHWDSANVPDDTLWIGIDEHAGATGSSSVGCDALSTVEGRHNMMFGPYITVDAITHELGHVFGMTHEAQRGDRDEYVMYSMTRKDNRVGKVEA